ncbi:MAG TPA: phosphatase PAP2 family protein [Bryobacteraceae bacterium]|nr:phosphatase PAP2 family protein [Bryobacteraceae bacterium]
MRSAEWVHTIFFAYASVLALLLPVSTAIRLRVLLVNVSVLLLLRWLTSTGKSLALRDAVALALVILAYKQMGWFAPSVHSFRLEKQWIVWDDIVLVDWGVKRAIEAAGPVLPNLLELSYLLVYAVGPFAVMMLYRYAGRKEIDTFLFLYILGVLLSYGQFPFWPSEPPRTVFPGHLEPAPSLFRNINLYVVGNAGIHTSVFPSAHVSGVVAAAFAMWKLLPGQRYSFLVYGSLVTVATFYGRYHYVVDAVAGVAVAVVAWQVTSWVRSRCSSRCEPVSA